MRHAALVLLCLSCAALGEPKKKAAKTDWKTNPHLTDADAANRCKAELPGCKAPFAQLDLPPHPCTGQGTRCQDEVVQAWLSKGRWTCLCAGCRTDADCPKGEVCSAPVAPCGSPDPGGPPRCGKVAFAEPCPAIPAPAGVP